MDVDSGSVETRGPPRPCEHLWFPDGNVVLATDSLLFKVHKGILALQSSVFKDMFELPGAHGLDLSQGQDSDVDVIVSELYEGLPLVTLVGDKGEDVVHLLRATYERHYYNPYADEATLDVVIALLLLSTKYDFKHIRQDAVRHISRHYPMDLKEYEDLVGEITFCGMLREEYHLKVLDAVFKAEVDVLLPILYYASSDYAIGDILSDAESMHIGPKCLATLLKGREKLESALMKVVATISELTFAESGNIGTCRSSDGKICLREHRFVGLDRLVDTASLQEINGLSVSRTCLPLETCAPCRLVVEELLDNKRQEIWDTVPSLFGFTDGGWDTLKTKLDEFFAS